MKLKNLSYILLVSLLLVFIPGCSQEDCSIKDTTYEKFTWDDDKGECVSKRINRDECGNGIEEEGENYCNCPKDVSKMHPEYGCSGEVGVYLEKSCNEEKECVLTQNAKVVEEVKSIELKNNDIYMDGRFTFNNPFILNTADKNKLKVEVSFLKAASSSKKIKNFAVKEIKIMSDSKMLGNAIYNENLANIGDRLSTKYIALADIDDYKKSMILKAELILSYTVDTLDSKGQVIKTEDKIETITGSLGRIEIINPVFFE